MSNTTRSREENPRSQSIISVKIGKWKISGTLRELHSVIPHITASGGNSNPILNRPLSIEDSSKETALDSAARFISYLIETRAADAILVIVFRCLERDFLQDTDPHSLSLRLDPILRPPFLKAFCQCFPKLSHPSKSALLKSAQDGKASLYAIFGGQGSANHTCLQDLRTLHSIYGKFLEKLVDIAASILSELALSTDAMNYEYDYNGFDLKRWLVEPEEAPDQVHIAAAPFSFPLIGLVSLAHFCIACKVFGGSPGDFQKALSGVTGHSQGIIVAAAVAQSTTWESFYEAVETGLKLLFWIGLESHYATPSVLATDEAESLLTSPMLSIRGLDQIRLASSMNEVNLRFEEREMAHVALVNSPNNMVVAGPPKTLLGLYKLLEQIVAPNDLDQSKIPYPRRRPVFEFSFLPISAPFHSPHLQDASLKVLQHLEGEEILRSNLSIPVHGTSNGTDLRLSTTNNLVEPLVRMVMTETVDWAAACLPHRYTHLLDFGPARSSTFLKEFTEGSGVRTINVFDIAASGNFGCKSELFAPVLPPKSPSWEEDNGPLLLERQDGELELDTKMTRLLGTPPVMVAGMTPTTVPWDFVSAVTNAGYHVELAAGGYVNPQSFEQAIRRIAASIPAHRGITCNLIYVNPKAMAWQIPLIKRLIASGIRIEGLTIGAGVPSLDIATNYIETIGIKHISFKPSSVSSIQNVLSIAESNPHFPICIQWTGGRAGGHHSYEDFHQPILKTYDQIRKTSNVVLIAGSGFGDASEVAGYLTGDWSRSLGYSAMPFDGILLGSRIMVAQEAHTSPQVKELIVQAQGCENSHWHKTYDEAVGGVVTVSSEMGQPIHKIANRGVLLWKDLDDRIFCITNPEKRLKALQSSRQEIISRLNNDYAKPWFAVDSYGICVDIEDLTYSECLHRLVKLMYVHSQKRWIDESYKKRVFAFANRFRERFREHFEPSSGFDMSENWDPALHLDEFLSCYGGASTELLYPEDVSYFIALCKSRGEKPVNFIPRLDKDFETWFKKDSLWQMEDIEAVVDQDPQRVCIIHGPVAIQHSTKADEPVASILDSITRELLEKLQPVLQKKLCIEKATPQFHSFPKLRGCFIQITATTSEYQFAEHGLLPEYEALINHILRSHEGWAQACLLDPYVRCESRVVKNPISAAFKPRHGDTIIATYKQNKQPDCIILNTKGFDGSTCTQISLKCIDGWRVNVKMQTPQTSKCTRPSIYFEFEFDPRGRGHRLHEDTKFRDKRIEGLYADLWGHGTSLSSDVEIGAEHQGESTTLSYQMVEAFMTAVAKSDVNQPGRESPSSKAVPFDVCIAICWTALTRPLVASGIGGDLLRLLHRSNSFQYCDGARPLSIGDMLETSSRVAAVIVQPVGKLITVVATVQRDKKPVVHVTSVFLIQGKFENDKNMFQLIDHPEISLPVASLKLQALLRSRSWLTFTDSTGPVMGTTLKIRLRTEQRPRSLGNDVKISGQIFQAGEKQTSRSVGTVDFSHPSCLGNPVVEFFERHGGRTHTAKVLKHPGWKKNAAWQIKIPTSSSTYSRVSKDTNPIHTCPIFARYVGLPGTVAHGMYTSAAVRRVVERVVANADCSRFRAWSCSFDGIVKQGDLLDVEIQHIAMSQGSMVISVRAYNSATRDKVLEAEANVEQARTAYLFCGQGSQEKGMGRTLYESNPAARMIWDQGDRYFLDTYGFSLLDIVTKDPKTLTIHFGGKRGRKIRNNYLAMTRKIIRNGKEIIEPILPGLMPASQSYSFTEERGLLFSTQFAQPALTLMEIAEFEALKSYDVVQQNSKFAGHSLGEYAALAACTSFMSLENLLDLVFYRGLSMQIVMDRDGDGRTDFSMVAVNPSRISRDLKEDFFREIVQKIADKSGLLLEIVNWNVEGQQYVCAGHLQALSILISTTNALSSLTPSSHTTSALNPLIAHHFALSKTLARPIELQRGVATNPLNGIDIPFHSTYLRGGVGTYREYLKEKVKENDLVSEELVGKWIPNLVGVPFGTGRDFVEKVAAVSGSRVLRGMLEGSRV